MRYSIKRMGQRGVTLVELVIALALLAILSTTSVLMCNSITSLVKYNRDTYADIENLTFTRSYIEKWFYTYDSADYKYQINKNKLTISKNVSSGTTDSKNASISIDVDTSTIKLIYIESNENNKSNENTNSESQLFSEYTFSGIKDISFEPIITENATKSGNNSTENVVNNTENISLYKCIITYDENEFFFVLSKNSK